MEQLHPGAKWLFRVKVYLSLLFLSFFFAPFLFSGLIFSAIIAGGEGFKLSFSGILLTFTALILIGELYARLAYNNWKYEFTPNELKLERGVIWKRYSSVPYERIQNVDIQRGILARIMGFSTLNVQTAGYHYAGNSGSVSEGHIPAVSVKKAEETREFLMKRIGKKQGI